MKNNSNPSTIHESDDDTVIKNDKMNKQLPEEQIEVIENGERIITHLKNLSDYYVNDEISDMLNYTIHYSYHRKSVPRKNEEAI